MPRRTRVGLSTAASSVDGARVTGSASRSLLNLLWILFLLPATLVVVILMASASADASAYPPSVRSLVRPTNPTLLWVFFLSSFLSTLAYTWSRRGATRATGLVVTVILAIVSLLLGLASYWPCADAEAAPFAPFYWSMALFVGNLERVPSGPAQCSAVIPLALQAARLTALTATFAGIAGIVVAVSRRRLESLIARYSRQVVLVFGLEPGLAGLLRVLAVHLDRHTRLVVIDSHGDPRIAVEARSVRATLVSLNLSVPRSLDELLIRRGRIKAREIYVLGSNLPETMRTVRRIEAAMSGHEASPTHIARVIVRIDDPWVAQIWRRKHVTAQTPWLADAVSFYEETARYVVEQANIAGADQIVLVGNSALSLAILAECAQLRRERRMLSRAAADQRQTSGRRQPAVVLMGEGSDQLMEDHRRVQEGFGNDSELPLVMILEQEVTVDSIVAVADRGPASLVALVAAPEENMGLGTRLAATRPDLVILAWSTAEPGIPVEPLMGRLYPFGLNMVGRDNRPPIDNWTRLARLLHEEYITSDLSVVGEVPPSRRPWDSGLPAFYQSSNVRQLSCLVSEVTRLGRSWSAPTAGEHGENDDWTEAEIFELAAAEHRSWRAFYLAHGWRYAPERDDTRLRHNLLTDWDRLDETVRQVNLNSVRRGLLLLESLGYRARRSAWHQYRRLGEVSAVRLTTAWTWTTEQGSRLVAKPGDWKVTADNGRVWSVDHERFCESYQPISGDRYGRTGVVRARLARAGERVDTMEGEGIAEQGDWVVEGESGDRWVVTASHFSAVYVRADHDNLPR